MGARPRRCRRREPRARRGPPPGAWLDVGLLAAFAAFAVGAAPPAATPPEVEDFTLSCDATVAEGASGSCTLANGGSVPRPWPAVGLFHLSSDGDRALVRGSTVDVRLGTLTPAAGTDGGVWWLRDVLVAYERFDWPGAAAPGASRLVPFAAVQDDDFEGSERFRVALAPSGSTGVGLLRDSTRARTVTIRDDEAQSADAALAGLALATGRGPLPLAFAAGTRDYAVTVPYRDTELVVTPTARHGRATIAVDGVAVESGAGSPAATLAVGARTVTVRVTAENGAAAETRIAVTRSARADERVEVAEGGFTLSCPGIAVEGSKATCVLTNGGTSAAAWPVVAVLHSASDAHPAFVAEDAANAGAGFARDVELGPVQAPAARRYRHGYGELFSGGSTAVRTTYGFQKFAWTGQAAPGDARNVVVTVRDDGVNEPPEVFHVALAPGGYTGLSRLVANRAPVVAVGVNRPATGEPVISGTARVGATLTAGPGSIADEDGLTKAHAGEAGAAFTYRWIRTAGGVEADVDGATAAAYVPVAGDLGATLKVVATFTDDAGNAERRTSAPTDPVEVAPDTEAPAVRSIASGADHPTKDPFAVTIAFSEPVTGFAADDVEVARGAASAFAGSGESYTVTVTADADYEGAVTVTVPAGAAEDAAGNPSTGASETFPVDTKAPALAAHPASVDGAALTLSYDEALDPDSVPAAAAFAVTRGGAARSVTAVALDGRAVVLTLGAAAAHGETGIAVSYAPPTGAGARPLRDAAGNLAAAFSGQTAANATPDANVGAASSFAAGDATVAVSAAGRVEAIRSGGRDYLAKDYAPALVKLIVADSAATPTGAARQLLPLRASLADGVYTLSYGEGVKATVALVEAAGYASLELASIENPNGLDIRAALWGPYELGVGEQVAEIAGVVYSRDFALGLQAANAKTFGGAPFEFANDVWVSPFDHSGSAILSHIQNSRNGTHPYWKCAARLTKFGAVLQAYSRDYSADRMARKDNFISADNVTPVRFIAAIEDAEHPLYAAARLPGSKIALFGLRRRGAESAGLNRREVFKREILGLIHRIELDQGIPYPTGNGGRWAKLAEDRKQRMLRQLPLTRTNGPALARDALRAGMDLYHMENGGGVFTHPGLSYTPKPAYGGSVETLRGVIAGIQAEGVRWGMHALPGLAYYRQGWTGVVIPGSDTEPLEAAISAKAADLTEAQRSTIVAAVSATGTVIDVAGQKVEFQVGRGGLSYTGAHSHKYAQIGDEIVVYTGTTARGDNIRLTGVVRGVYRTPTAAYEAGTTIRSLAAWGGINAFVWDIGVVGESARALAGAIDGVGMNLLALDAVESWHKGMYGMLGLNAFYEALFNALESRELSSEGSVPTHYVWHFHDRFVWGEQRGRFLRGTFDMQLASNVMLTRNFFPDSLGGFYGSDNGIYDYEWLGSKIAAFDAAMVVRASHNGGNFGNDKRDATRRWIELAEAGALADVERARLKPWQSSFELEEVEAGRSWRLWDRALDLTFDAGAAAGRKQANRVTGINYGERSNPMHVARPWAGHALRNIAGDALVETSSRRDVSFQGDNVVDGHIGVTVVTGYRDGGHVSEWATKEEDGERWVELSWDAARPMREILLSDRANATDNVTAYRIDFDDGEPIVGGALPPRGRFVRHRFAERRSARVRVTVTGHDGVSPGLSEIVVIGPDAQYLGDLAAGAAVVGGYAGGDGARLFDGDLSAHVDLGTGVRHVVVDLGDVYLVDGLNVSRGPAGATYADLVYQLSTTADFGGDVATVFNNDADDSAKRGTGSDAEYAEEVGGRPVYFAPVRARYVRLWSGGDGDGANRLAEIEVHGLKNLAHELAATTDGAADGAARATDGDPTGDAWNLGAGLRYAQFDLGSARTVDSLRVWHSHADERRYRDVVFQLSDDPAFASGVTTVFNNDLDDSSGLGAGQHGEYTESASGKIVAFAPVAARYVRLYSNGNTRDANNHYAEVMIGQAKRPSADTTAPTATLTSAAPRPANDAFAVTVAFSEPVTGLAADEIAVENGSASGFAGSGDRYAVTVTPDADFEGEATVTVAADAAVDAAGNGNAAASASFPVDTRAPTATVASAAAQPIRGPFAVAIAFSEPVTGLAADEIAVTNGSASALAGSGATYTLSVTPAAGFEGDVTVTVPGGAAADAAGNPSGAAGRAFEVDTKAPALAAADPAVVDGAALTLRFDEALDADSVPAGTAFAVTGGDAARTVTAVSVDDTAVALTVDPPVAHGETDIAVGYTPPGAVPLRDAPGNAVAAFAGREVANATADATAPTATFASDATFPTKDAFVVTITFSEPVTGLAADEVAVDNGSASGFAGSGDSYTVTVTPDADFDGLVTVTVPADAAADTAEFGNAEASETFEVDTKAPALAESDAAVVDGAALTLTFDEALDTDSVPAGTAFVVTGGDATRTVTAVSVDGRAVALTVDPPAAPGEDIAVAYTPPGAAPLRDAPGNAAAAFAGRPAANRTSAWGARLPHRDIELAGASTPAALWSDGTTLWAADRSGGALRAYVLSNGARRVAGDIPLDAARPSGLWSDRGDACGNAAAGDADATLWVSDFRGGIHGYRLSDGARAPDADFDESVLDAAGNGRPTGLWSDGVTLWAADYLDSRAYAYRLGDKSPDAAGGFDFGPKRARTFGLWSDGTTLWAADYRAGRVKAYRMSDKTRDTSLDIDTAAAGNDRPMGLWSDCSTLWVSDQRHGKAFAYAIGTGLPTPVKSDDATLRALGLAGIDFGAFSPATTTYAADVAHGMSRTTVTATPSHPGAVPTIDPADADGNTAGHQVALEVGANTVAATVTAEDGATTRTYRVTVTRAAAAADTTRPGVSIASGAMAPVRGAFDVSVAFSEPVSGFTRGEIAVGNGTVSAFGGSGASYTATIEPASSLTDDVTVDVAAGVAEDAAGNANTAALRFRIAADTRSSDATLAALSLSGIDIGAFSAADADYEAAVGHAVERTTVTATPAHAGATAAVADANGSSTGGRRTVELAAGANTITVMVTAEDGTTRTYTVTVTRAATSQDAVWGARLPHRDIDLAGAFVPAAVWSDGTTLWAADWSGRGLLAYALSDGARQPRHDIALEAASPSGLWSDRGDACGNAAPGDADATLWVSDYSGGVFGYRLSDGARAPDADFDESVLDAAGNGSPTGIWSDGETLWAADHGGSRAYAYSLADKTRDEAAEFYLGRRGPRTLGLWSDGTTLWAAQWKHGSVQAYRLADKTRDASRDIDTAAAGNDRPMGLWSDCSTLWVSDQLDTKAYAYSIAGAPPPAPDAAAPAVPDANLRAGIAATLGLAAGADVTTDALAALRSLIVEDVGVADLKGLELAAGLRTLDLSGNAVSDLGPLARLATLERLDLSGNVLLADLAPLAGLQGLERLDLAGNAVSDLAPLAGLTRLAVLDVTGNMVRDVGPLAGLAGLAELDIAGNGVADFAPLDRSGGLALRGRDRQLAVPASSPRAYVPDARLHAALAAALGKAPDAPLTVAELGLVTALDRAGFGVTDLTGLEHATRLRALRLPGGRVTELWPLAGLTALERLHLPRNAVRDLEALAGLVGLRALNLSDNAATDLRPLAGLVELRRLDLSGNGIEHVDALRGLMHLRELDLSDNAVYDASWLRALPELRVLDLSGNPDGAAAPAAAAPSRNARREGE